MVCSIVNFFCPLNIGFLLNRDFEEIARYILTVKMRNKVANEKRTKGYKKK